MISLTKAKLFNELMPLEMVEFDFNPESLTYKRETNSSNRTNASSSGAGSTPSIFFKAAPKSLSGKGYIVGDWTYDRVKMLYNWMDPGGGLLMQLAGAVVSAATGGRINLGAKQPTLIFQWGTQIMRCVLTQVSVVFERFNDAGSPDRAAVTFTVKEEKNLFGLLPTNPTSGGLPGRQRHTVTHGETVHSITTRAYGKPNLWRGVADANNIDDPFRVRSGDTVYIPNPNEIVGKR